MPKAVFTTKVNPAYDDLPEERYHFPRSYLNAARAALGDWIVYYEPRRSSADLSSSGGRLSYFATARLVDIQPDPTRANHYYGYVEHYLEFDEAVPFREADSYYERDLRKADGSTNKGRFGRAVRPLRDSEYHLILAAGFQRLAGDAKPFVADRETETGLGEPGVVERPVFNQLVRRPFRDRVFSSAVKQAYDDTCAITGIKIINGGGRSEAEAAHIRPVAANGPDSMRNGLALSGTVHWMFDRGLISIDDDYSLLLKEDSIPGDVLRIINRNRHLRLPSQPLYHPHRSFLKYHRENVFVHHA